MFAKVSLKCDIFTIGTMFKNSKIAVHCTVPSACTLYYHGDQIVKQ